MAIAEISPEFSFERKGPIKRDKGRNRRKIKETVSTGEFSAQRGTGSEHNLKVERKPEEKGDRTTIKLHGGMDKKTIIENPGNTPLNVKLGYLLDQELVIGEGKDDGSDKGTILQGDLTRGLHITIFDTNATIKLPGDIEIRFRSPK